jgi:hypothetical protein
MRGSMSMLSSRASRVALVCVVVTWSSAVRAQDPFEGGMDDEGESAVPGESSSSAESESSEAEADSVAEPDPEPAAEGGASGSVDLSVSGSSLSARDADTGATGPTAGAAETKIAGRYAASYCRILVDAARRSGEVNESVYGLADVLKHALLELRTA